MVKAGLVEVAIIFVLIVAVVVVLLYRLAPPAAPPAATSVPTLSTSTSTSTSTTLLPRNATEITLGQWGTYPQMELQANAITSNPVNLSQIARVSKFRSCAVRDFSGYSFNGTAELGRSMKTYFNASAAAGNGTNTSQIFAPFNGVVIFLNASLDYPRGQRMVMVPDIDQKMGLEIFHINPAPGIKVGLEVGSGQPLGHGAGPGGFDMALGMVSLSWPNGGLQTPMINAWDSIFNHMTAPVLAQYAAFGITPGSAMITKAARDAMPCNYPNDTASGISSAGGPYANASWNWISVARAAH